MFVLFGLNAKSMSSTISSIEKINAKDVVNGNVAKWTLIELRQTIQIRLYALSSLIDDNEIVIIGGRN